MKISVLEQIWKYLFLNRYMKIFQLQLYLNNNCFERVLQVWFNSFHFFPLYWTLDPVFQYEEELNILQYYSGDVGRIHRFSLGVWVPIS